MMRYQSIMIGRQIIICLYIIPCDKQMNFSNQILNLQCYSSSDIVKKCKKYPQFRQQLQEMEVEFAHDLNMAIYASLDQIQSMGVFQIHHQNTMFVSFYAYLMPPQQCATKCYLLWIKLLDQNLRLNIGKKYTIIYYHTLCESNYPYNFLVGIFKKLPIYYYAMLDKIYTVDATFFLRKSAGLFDFGRLYKLFQRKIQSIEKISQFANMPEIVKNNLLERLPEKLMHHFQLKTKKNLKNLPTHQSQMQQPPLSKVMPLVVKKDSLTINLSQHKLDKDGIPVALSIVINSLKRNVTFLELQGIFRKSGSIQEEQEIIEQLSKLNDGEQLKNIAEYSGFAIAGVVKKFFTKLLAPIVPYSVYNYILSILSQSSVKPQQQVSFVIDFLNQLPPLNKKIVLYLMTFLKLEVISRQQKNKMNHYNMSVCFCPCIFRSESPTLADLLNSGKFAGILNIFFNRFEEIIGITQRSSKDKQKLQDKSRKSKAWQSYRISMA